MMKEAFGIFFCIVAIMAIFYLLENSHRFAAIADRSLDRIEGALSAPQTTIHKQQDRVSLPCPDQGEGK